MDFDGQDLGMSMNICRIDTIDDISYQKIEIHVFVNTFIKCLLFLWLITEQENKFTVELNIHIRYHKI